MIWGRRRRCETVVTVTYVSFEKVKGDFSFHVFLAFLQTESHIVCLRAVPIPAVHLVSKLPG